MALKGRKQTEEHKRKRSEAIKLLVSQGKLKVPNNCGRILSKEHRKKLSEAHKGPRPWRVGKPIFALRGEKNIAWKGDGVGYDALHRWLGKVLGKPQKCDNKNCKYPRLDARNKLMQSPKRYEWANLSREYKRIKEDWIRLCPSCHRLFDYGKLILN
jgi:hypothetical protein